MAKLGFSSWDIFLQILALVDEFQMTERDGWVITGPLQARPAQREQTSGGQNQPCWL